MSLEGSGASRASSDLHNEDTFLVDEGLGIYAVCDGVGGRPAGEVAARIAVHAIEEFVSDARVEIGAIDDDEEARGFADRAIRFAMERIVEAADSEPELQGMATTVTMLMALGRTGVVGHIGDSRAYLIRHRTIHQLTTDHELTAAIDRPEPVAAGETPIETFCVDLRPGDTFLLCTDGAETVVEHPSMLKTSVASSPRMLASRVASAAHKIDPSRDATVVVVRVRSDGETGWLSVSRDPRPTSFGHALAFSWRSEERVRERAEDEREEREERERKKETND